VIKSFFFTDAKQDQHLYHTKNVKSTLQSSEVQDKNKNSDDLDETNLLPTGIEKLKAALTSAIASNTAVKSLVAQTGSADSVAIEHQTEKSMDEEVLLKSPSSQALIQTFAAISPIRNVDLSTCTQEPISKIKVSGKRLNSDESDLSESEGEAKIFEEKRVANIVPTRRSSRSTRCTKSYREISSDDDHYDYEEFKPVIFCHCYCFIGLV